jgi:N-acetylglucosaminyl-diphospho-decaprenol L-rhamnosyltransferase
MTVAINHVLLTRFNLPSRGAESFIRARENWLRLRMNLFEHYCVPSVRSQSVDNLSWIVYLDPESPNWLKARMAEIAETTICTPIYRDEVPRAELLADIKSVVGTAGDWLVTTNLDNDDSLAFDFAERVQSVAVGTSRRAVYVDNGLVLSAGRIYLRRDRQNAFCSVAESWASPGTCWSAWHNELHRTMPVAHISGRPSWLQVVHGDNVSNRVRGHLVSPDPYRAHFPGLIDEVTVPSLGVMIADRLLHSPSRVVREAVRGRNDRNLWI